MDRKIYNKYSPTAKGRLMNVKKNAIFIHNSGKNVGHKHIKHELSKCLGAIMLHKWSDIQFDAELIDMLDVLSIYVQEVLFKGWSDNHSDFITEAWLNDKRRVDLVDLSNGNNIEFETDRKVCKKGATTIYI